MNLNLIPTHFQDNFYKNSFGFYSNKKSVSVRLIFKPFLDKYKSPGNLICSF